MMRRGSLLAGVALALLLRLTGTASAQANVDLTEYLDGSPQVADSRVAISSNGTVRTTEIVDVSAWKRTGRRVLARFTSDDVEWYAESFWHPKKGGYIGDLIYPDSHFDFKPTRSMPLKLRPGKMYRVKTKGRLYYGPDYVGKVSYARSVVFLGFEDVSTSYFSSTRAAVVQVAEQIVIRSRFADFTAIVSGNETRWIDRDLGVVSSLESVQSYQDGVLVDELNGVTFSLQSLVISGETHP